MRCEKHPMEEGKLRRQGGSNFATPSLKNVLILMKFFLKIQSMVYKFKEKERFKKSLVVQFLQQNGTYFLNCPRKCAVIY